MSCTNPMGLGSALLIGHKRGLNRGDHTPEWASFMTLLGWWLSSAGLGRGTLHCVTVVPRRECCSALVALGSHIASAQQHFDQMEWPTFLELPENSPVFFRLMRGKKMQPFQGVLRNGAVERPREMDIEGEKVKIWVNPRNFPKYGFRLTPYLTGRQWRITNSSELYRELIDDFDTQWCLSGSRTCLVVTVMARWYREIEDIRIAAGGRSSDSSGPLHPLKNVLMVGPQAPAPGIKTVLHPPGGTAPEGGEYHLAVVDGPGALRTIPWVRARTILILLSQAEHDEGVSSALAEMTCRRDDGLAADLPPFPARLPPGVDLIVFVNPDQQL